MPQSWFVFGIDSAQFNNNLGVTLMRLGRFEEALIRFERALTVEPNNIDALYD